MRFNGVCLVSRDVKGLREFCGFALRVEAERDDIHVKLETADDVLSIFSESGMEQMAPGSMKNYGHGAFTIEFEVHNVDE